MSKRVSNRKGASSKNKSKHRVHRAEPIPGRRESMNMASAILLGVITRMFAKRRARP